MKIACIGGVKHGNSVDQANDYDKAKLKWEFETDLPPRQPTFQTNSIGFTNRPETQTYHLKLIKKNGELKFFYVAHGLLVDEIKAGIDEHWEISDNIGYDFD